jgi:Virulence factor BrkB
MNPNGYSAQGTDSKPWPYIFGQALRRTRCPSTGIGFFVPDRHRVDESVDDMLWTVVKEAAQNWSDHKDSRQGAALAYYSVFSLRPIIVIAIAVAGFFFGREAVSGQVASSIKGMLGDTGAHVGHGSLTNAMKPRKRFRVLQNLLE